MQKRKRILVTGAGGFIGRHLVKHLKHKRYRFGEVDIKYPEYENTFGVKKLRKRYDITKPQGVRGRNCDSTRLQEVLKWGPEVSLVIGFGTMYKWIHERMRKTGRLTSEEHNAYPLESFQFQNPPLNPKNN